jgi:uncharacterized protein involved in propanediol utilization
MYGACEGTPPTTVNFFQHGCIMIQTDTTIGTSAIYENTGTYASPSWSLLPSTGSGITQLTGDVTAGPGTGSQAATITANAVTTAKILNANVTLAKLSAGITPSHVVKFAGKITWSGSGASLATTVAGVAATDIVVASIQTVPTQAAYLVSAAPTTNTVTLILSAANTSNDAVISYQVLRAAV